MAAFYVLTLVPVVVLSIAIYRFWACIRRMGYYRELVRRAPQMMPLDGVTIGMAGLVFYYAAMGWWGFILPFLNDEPLPKWQNIFMSMGSFLAFAGVAWMNAIRRFDQPSWGGMREGAVRTLAAFRILDAAELAHALDYLQAHEAAQRPQGAGRIIDAEAREVRK